MNGRHAIAKRFGDSERERLTKLFRQLGTDNLYEAEAARSRITSLLQTFDKDWDHLVELLSRGRLAIDPAIADIAGLGNPDPDQRARIRRNLASLLARHRRNWNDLADALCLVTSADWLIADDPDPERVNPLALIHHLLQDYVAFREPHEYIAVALWILHTHVFDQFMVTPRLALRSPVANCGKTTLMDILGKMVSKPDKFDSVTAAVLYRVIDATHPTLLIDEVDNLALALQGNGKIRAVFNSGHRKGGKVAILENGEPKRFQVFAPLALALPDTMRGLPRTLNSRCITLTMQRADRSRALRRFDVNKPDGALDAVYRQILLWRRDLEPLNLDPEMPSTIRNRLADNWRPLISIADAIDASFPLDGGRWGVLAREAMIKFAAEFQDADARVALLESIRRVFDASRLDRIPSRTLLDELHQMNDADWKEFPGIRGEQQPHPLKDSELAIMLKDFKIKPHTIWPPKRTSDSKSTKGYLRSQFEQAWRMYCDEPDTSAQPSKVKGLRSS
jgi:Protein of unknown function (DUF3631)